MSAERLHNRSVAFVIVNYAARDLSFSSEICRLRELFMCVPIHRDTTVIKCQN